MKKIKNISYIVLFAFVLFACTACSKYKEKNFNENVLKNMESVKEVSITSSMMDQNVLVYSFSKEVSIENKIASVVETTQELDASFSLSSSSDAYTVDDVTSASLFGIQISKSTVTKFTYDSSKASFEVTPENIKSVFSDISIVGNATFSFVFENDKLTNYTIHYTLSSGRTVVTTGIYLYE